MKMRLRSKIHRAKVTHTSIDYEGSISIDESLLKKANIDEYDQVQVVNLTNGNRFWSYAIEGTAGEICINGAAAHLSDIGDLVIIMTYGIYENNNIESPTVLRLDENNKIIDS